MSLIVEIIPQSKQFEVSSEDASRPEMDLFQRLQSAYHQRFAIYEKDLIKILKPTYTPFEDSELTNYPRLSVEFDGEGDEIVFDFSLFESLLETYIFEGWSGILQIEKVLENFVPKSAQLNAPSGGVPKNPGTHWIPTKSFFLFTKNLIALLIRDSLIEIERKVATVITTGLSLSSIQVAKAWTDELKFEREEIKIGLEDPYEPPNRPKNYKYTCKNRKLSDTLFNALSEVVQQRDAYEELLREIADTQSKLQSGDHAPISHEHHFFPTGDKLARNIQLAEQSKQLLEGMKKALHGSCPLGLIVLDGLKIGFTQIVMENKLGMALWEIYGKIDKIGYGIDSRLSLVAAAWSAPVIEENLSFAQLKAIQDWSAPTDGFENFVANLAIERLASNSGWFPLAHEETWHRLVASGEIVKDSVEYIVYFHYILALNDRFEAERKTKEKFDNFMKVFSRATAALSLASLATPAAEFAPVLRGVSVFADLVVLTNTIHSVYGNLAQLDQLLANELILPDAFALENLARIGELVQIRRETVDQLEWQILTELALTTTGARWALVKKLTFARGYYFDLETLLDLNIVEALSSHGKEK